MFINRFVIVIIPDKPCTFHVKHKEKPTRRVKTLKILFDFVTQVRHFVTSYFPVPFFGGLRVDRVKTYTHIRTLLN